MNSKSLVGVECTFCDTPFQARLEHIVKGTTRSCGCIAKENHLVHGHSRIGRITPEFRAWVAMKNRCYNPNNKNYLYYGGRGIYVDARWRDSFKNFIHDMGKRPSFLHSLDRLNNNLSYGPENCRWATRSEQALNRRPKSYGTNRFNGRKG